MWALNVLNSVLKEWIDGEDSVLNPAVLQSEIVLRLGLRGSLLLEVLGFSLCGVWLLCPVSSVGGALPWSGSSVLHWSYEQIVKLIHHDSRTFCFRTTALQCFLGQNFLRISASLKIKWETDAKSELNWCFYETPIQPLKPDLLTTGKIQLLEFSNSIGR